MDTKNLPPGVVEALPEKIQDALHQRNLRANELAEYLGMTASGFSRCMDHPKRLVHRLPKIATYFNTDVEKLLLGGPIMAEVVEPNLHFLYGEPDKDGAVPVSAGSILRHVSTTDNRYISVWLLLGPIDKAPRDGDLVWVRIIGGKEYVRTWTRTEDNENVVVLTDRAPASRPVVVTITEILEARLVAAVTDLVTAHVGVLK